MVSTGVRADELGGWGSCQRSRDRGEESLVFVELMSAS